MRVLNVCSILEPIKGGGMIERTFQMSRTLVKAGVECSLLITDLGLTEDRRKDLSDIKVLALPCIIKRFYIPKVSLELIRNIVKEVDIIHLMGHWSFLNALIYIYARLLHKPYVLCSAGSLSIYGRSKIFKRIYNFLIGNRIIKNASGLIAITKEEIAAFRFYGIRGEDVTIIPNGINVDDYVADDIKYFREKYKLGDYPLLLFLGRLNPIKGPDLLLQAFCQVKNSLLNYHLVFVGPDEGILTDLKKIALVAGISDRVHFLDYLGGKDKALSLRSAELVIIPSRREAMSIVVLEAGIVGKPVLLTNQCGFIEITEIGGGLVVEASAEGLEKGLIEILKDSDRLKLMGNNFRNYVLRRYTWNTIVNEHIDLYNKILQRRSNYRK
jgi:glycosyltransferase involved in cell wall biosynthesis